jgi:hypothetical protein
MAWRDELVLYTKEPKLVTNMFSGAECELTPEALAMYDFIKGSEVLIAAGMNSANLVKNFNEALMCFRETWPEEYFILLD